MRRGVAGRRAYEADSLIGRANELDSLERALDDLDGGTSGALEVVGEPGIGKTRLLWELGTRAELRGHLVLGGSATDVERDLPFSVFVHALDEYVESLEPDQLSGLDDDVQAELAQVFPSLALPGGGRQVALQNERYRSHRAVRELLTSLARTRPLVLTLDDVHWADSASIELLGALLRRPPAGAVLIAFSLRPRQIPERLSAPLERAHREGQLTRIDIVALSRAEARAFLGDGLDPARVDALYEESGGNPFYLQELAKTLDMTAKAGAAIAELSLAIGVPPAIAAALTEELGSLTEPARMVLEGAAVAGDPFEPELAAAATGASEGTTMEAVDELLRFDLVRATDVPRRFRFRHPLVRRAIYETAPAGWRLGAHERCAEALALQGASAAVRAHHIERSAREGDLDAVAVLRDAGESTARLAPASSARWFGAALRLLPETGSSEARVALLMAHADSLAAIGRFAESHADLLECIEVVQRGAEDWRVRVATACAAVEHLLGLQKEASRHLATALAELGGAQSADAVELMIELSIDGFHAGDYEAMRDWAERAVAAAASLGDRALRAATLSVRAWAAAVGGAGALARAYCDEATEVVDELSDGEVARRLNALAHLTGADVWLDRYSTAIRHARRALEICRRTGQGEQFPLIVQMLGVSLWVQGRPLEAEELFDGAVEAARLSGNLHNLAWNLFNRSLASIAAGDLDAARATAEEAVELEADMDPGPISGASAATLASALLEAGQAERSVELLLSRVGGDELRLIPGGWRARFLEVLTRALLASGRRADAARAAAAAQACADAMSVPMAEGMASLAAASLALDTDEPAAAVERASTAAAAFEAAESPWDAARARELAGRALVQAGEPDRAVAELEHAAAAFDSFGAIRYRDQAERELRKLGRHIQRRTRSGVRDARDIAVLTARELEIGRLVVDRKTNAQIAGQLFLSPKTVETHLRNIFHKMEVSSRVELARAIERADRAAAQGRADEHDGIDRVA